MDLTPPGRLSRATKDREAVSWPPLTFDAPGGAYNNAAVRVSSLPRYAATRAGLILPGPDEEGDDRRPREASESEMGAGGGGAGVRRWMEEIRGCEGRYPRNSWDAVGVEVEEPWCGVEGATG